MWSLWQACGYIRRHFRSIWQASTWRFSPKTSIRITIWQYAIYASQGLIVNLANPQKTQKFIIFSRVWLLGGIGLSRLFKPFVEWDEFCHGLRRELPLSYCADGTDPIKHFGASELIPDFINAPSKFGSSAKPQAPVTPKWGIHTCTCIYYVASVSKVQWWRVLRNVWSC